MLYFLFDGCLLGQVIPSLWEVLDTSRVSSKTFISGGSCCCLGGLVYDIGRPDVDGKSRALLG